MIIDIPMNALTNEAGRCRGIRVENVGLFWHYGGLEGGGVWEVRVFADTLREAMKLITRASSKEQALLMTHSIIRGREESGE